MAPLTQRASQAPPGRTLKLRALPAQGGSLAAEARARALSFTVAHDTLVNDADPRTVPGGTLGTAGQRGRKKKKTTFKSLESHTFNEQS